MPNLYYNKECNYVAYTETIEEATSKIADKIRLTLSNNADLVDVKVRIVNMNTIRITCREDIESALLDRLVSVHPVMLPNSVEDVEDLIRILERKG